MPVFRSPLIWAAPIVGLALAAIFWLTLGGSARLLSPIDDLERTLASLPAPLRVAGGLGADATAAIARPLFAPNLGRISLRVDGLSRSPGRAAALISVNGGAAQWVTLGSTVSGVTLVMVSDRRITVDSATGRRDIRLGETSGDPPDVAASTPAAGEATAGDEPPAGVKLFPPASAPTGTP